MFSCDDVLLDLKYIDTHSHIYLEDFDNDRSEVLDRAIKNSVLGNAILGNNRLGRNFMGGVYFEDI